MKYILRIKDKFKITGRGFVYAVDINDDLVIHIGDVLTDILGNSFSVRGIEMATSCLTAENDKRTIGLMFDLLDDVEVHGAILISGEAKENFLFCNHPLYQRKVDDDYEEEFKQLSKKYTCGLFSYEDLEKGKLSLYGDEITDLVIYRGWMMRPEMYRRLYKLLEEKGIYLINSPDEYERYHLLPGWYNDFEKYTPKTVWESEGNIDSAMMMTNHLGGDFIVKDYVKSRKHEWYDACYIKDVTNKEDTSRVIGNFIERQGEALVGGIVLRKFEQLNRIGNHDKSGMPLSEEYRAFIFAGKVLIIDDYWRKGNGVTLSSDELSLLQSIAKEIRSNFVTIDLARKKDGKLIVMELGDGQVSGLQQISVQKFFDAFLKINNN